MKMVKSCGDVRLPCATPVLKVISVGGQGWGGLASLCRALLAGVEGYFCQKDR